MAATVSDADSTCVGDDPLRSYRCPTHGTEHAVPETRGFERRYAVAVSEGACLCPGKAPWFVRCGVSRARVLFWLLLGLWVFNVLDFLLTRRAIALGRATEANGVMGYLLHVGTSTAFAFKMGLVTVGCLLFWRLRRHDTVLFAAVLLAAVFAAVVIYQTLWIASF